LAEFSNNLITQVRILLVDDETELTAPLSRVLQQEGYQVDVAQTGQAGLALATNSEQSGKGYDLLILDWMLPELSGVEICQQLRQQGHSTPVLFLTAKDTLDDRVQGLDAGANDYLIKPFELRELLARVRVQLRSQSSQAPDASSGNLLRIDDLELDSTNQVAHRNGRTIELSEKETRLLTYLMQHPAQLLTHEAIQEFLWGGEQAPTSNVLAAQIRLLRRKVEAKGSPTLIHTVYGKGYRFGGGAEG